MRSESQISSGWSPLPRACARSTSPTVVDSLDMVALRRGERVAKVAPDRTQIGFAGRGPGEIGDDRDDGRNFVTGQSGLQEVDEFGRVRRSWRSKFHHGHGGFPEAFIAVPYDGGTRHSGVGFQGAAH